MLTNSAYSLYYFINIVDFGLLTQPFPVYQSVVCVVTQTTMSVFSTMGIAVRHV